MRLVPPAIAPASNQKQTPNLLLAWRQGDGTALDSLIALIYAGLHPLVRDSIRPGAPQLMSSGTLVNEAYVRLVNPEDLGWEDRAYFLAIAAQALRHILIDMLGERKQRRWRSGDARRLRLNEALVFSNRRAADLIALDAALQDLAKLDERQSRVVEMRYFGGLSVEETAEVLQISPATVDRDWTQAQVWLQGQSKRSTATQWIVDRFQCALGYRQTTSVPADGLATGRR